MTSAISFRYGTAMADVCFGGSRITERALKDSRSAEYPS